MTIATLEDLARSALDTLLVLLKHQRTCRQCHLDETFCDTATAYQSGFMTEVRRYARTRDKT